VHRPFRERFPASAVHTPPFRTGGMTGNRPFTVTALTKDGEFPHTHIVHQKRRKVKRYQRLQAYIAEKSKKQKKETAYLIIET